MKMMARNAIVILIALALATGIGARRLSAATDEEIRQYQALVRKYNSDRGAGRFQEAEADARQILDFSQRVFPDLPRLTAAGTTYLALAYVGQGRYAEAEKYAVRALRLWESSDAPAKNIAVAEALNHLANIYVRQARYPEAEPFYRRLTIQQKEFGPNHPGVATTICNLGLLYDCEEKYDQAEPLYQRALAIRERALGPENLDVAASLNNLANLYNRQRKNAQAEVLYQRALAIEQKLLGRVHPEVALTLNNLASIYEERSQYAQAAAMYEESLAIREKMLGPKHPAVGQSLVHLASLHNHFGRFEKAEALSHRALEIEKELLGPDHPSLAATLDMQASIFDSQGKFAEAIDRYQQALAIYEKAYGRESVSVATTLNNLGDLYMGRNDYEHARPIFDRAIQILTGKRIDLDLHFKCYRQRAIARWHAGDQSGAMADLHHALEMLESLRGEAGGTEKERAEFLADYRFAFEEMLEWQLELGHLDQAFAAAEQCRARTLLDQLKVQGADLLEGLPAAEAKRLKDRDNAARAQVATLEQQLDLLSERQDLEEAPKNNEGNRLADRLAAAQQEQIESYRAIRNASPAYQSMVTQDFKPVELATLDDWAKQQHALLLQYFLGDDGGYLFVLAADREPQVVKLEITKDQLAEFASVASESAGATDGHRVAGRKRQFQLAAGPLTHGQMELALTIDGQVIVQRMATAEKDDAVTARLAALWKLLIPAPQRASLLAGNYERLIVVPDGPLVNLPFDALVAELGENPAYLLDRGPPMVECPSATLLYNLAQRERTVKKAPGKPTVLTVGNPNYPSLTKPGGNRSGAEMLAGFRPAARYASRGNLQPLPHSGTEVAWVAEAFTKNGLTANKLLRADATEANLRSRVAGQEIVHLACHGLVDTEQGNFFGALALTPGAKAGSNPADDGFLTLPEIYELNLKGCELSILSACQTNFGPQQRGEGVWALSRGFLVAGSRRVVASNWLVDDEAAASLIYYFCAGVAQQENAEGGKKAESRRQKAESQESGGRGQESDLAAGLAPLATTTVDYAKALHDAKLWIRHQSKWQHPYYWATFTLIGPN